MMAKAKIKVPKEFLIPSAHMALERCRQNRCPKCGSDQIEGDSVEIMPGSARQDVSCLECDSTWCEFYKMDHMSFYGNGGEDEKT